MLRILSSLTLVVALCTLSGSGSAVPRENSVPEAATLLSGDLVFRRGTSWRSAAVAAASEAGAFTHVGIVWIPSPGDVRIVHADPDGGVIVEPIARFLSAGKASHWDVRRPRLSAQARVQGAETALGHLGKVFDSRMSLEDDRELYCTELVLVAFSPVHQDLSGGTRDTINAPLLGRGVYLTPSTLYNSSHLSPVRASTTQPQESTL